MALVSALTQLGLTPEQSRHLGFDVAINLTATGNASQANAYQLTAHHTQFTTSTGAGNSAKLPLAINAAYGMYHVRNDDFADNINVYPGVGDSINSLATNTGIVIPPGWWASFYRISNIQWISEGGVTPVKAGGTGFAGGISQGDMIYADAANQWALLPKNTTTSRALLNTGASNNPQWGLVDLVSGCSSTRSSWTPTRSSQAGTWTNNSLQYSVYINIAGYKVEAGIYYNGTQSVANANYLTFTLPVTSAALGNDQYHNCYVEEAGTATGGYIVIPSGSATARVYKQNNAQFGGGGLAYVIGNFFYFI